MLIADAVFEGGGVKGIGLVGAVCRMEEKGYRWNNLAGTSAGAIVAALLASGYSGIEISKIIFNFDFKKYLPYKNFPSVYTFLRSFRIFMDNGIFSGNIIENWIRKILSKKGKIKFKDVSENGKSKLKIIATDITRRELLILPDDLVNYNLDPLEFDIAKAVRMSIGIPFLFKPIKLIYRNNICYIVDGGILSNYPIWIFDVSGKPRWPTFGFKLVEPYISKTSLGKKNFLSYTLDIANTLFFKNEEIYVKEKDWVRTIAIPTLGIRTIEFGLTEEKKKSLFYSGYNAAEKFLSCWNFEEYVQKYRSK